MQNPDSFVPLKKAMIEVHQINFPFSAENEGSSSKMLNTTSSSLSDLDTQMMPVCVG